MEKDSQAEVLFALHKIEDRLKEIVEILKLGNKETIEAIQRRTLDGSPLRRGIYDLCNGKRSVSEVSKILGKSLQQISNNIVILQNAGLIKEVRVGKEKFYEKMGR